MIVDRGPSVCADFAAPTAQIVSGFEMEMVNTKTVSTKPGEVQSSVCSGVF